MSSIAYAIAEYLSGLANAAIPDNAYKQNAPQGTTGDHIVVTKYDGDPLNDLAGRSSGLRSAEFDIDCKSSNPETADAMAEAVIGELEPYQGDLNADWNCQAVILNNQTEAYLPPPGDGRDVSLYLATVEITMQYQPAA